MPHHFEFAQEHRDGLQLIRWLGEPTLPGWSRDDLWTSDAPRFVHDFVMSQWSALLYPGMLGLVWHLTTGLERFALPVFDGVSDCERLGRPYELVRWEYGIEWEQRDWRSRDRGFVLAESHRTVPGSRPRSPSFERFEGAALTPVSTWPDLMSMIPVGDQANTLCLFAVKPETDGHARLTAALRSDQPPRLDEVLASDEDVFAVITQEDEGMGLSSLMIAGRERIHRSFSTEAARLENRLDAYLAGTAAARTQEEWSAAVDRLADITP